MSDRVADTSDSRGVWADRATQQYALRQEVGVRRVLMTRHADDEGKGHDGDDVPWRDIATFASYNDAESVLRKLRS